MVAAVAARCQEHTPPVGLGPRRYRDLPSLLTEAVSLPLLYEGDTARAVRILRVRVLNYGKQSIGRPEDLWSISLASTPGSRLIWLRPPTVVPPVTVIQIRRDSAPSQVTINLGVFQPRAQIDLTLLLVNDLARRQPGLRVSTTMVGLPSELTFTSPEDAIESRILGPVLLTALLGWFALVFQEAIATARRTSGWRRVKELGARVLGVFMLSLLTGGAVVWLLGKVISALL